MEQIIILFLVLVGIFIIRKISKRRGKDVARAQVPVRYWLPAIIIVILVISVLGGIAYFHDKNWRSPSLAVFSVESELETGKTYPIQWQSTGIDKVKISVVNYDCLSRNSTTSIENIFLPSEMAKTEVCYGRIIDDFSAKDKVYNWSVPANLFSAYPAWQSGDSFKILITGRDKKGQIRDSKDSPNYFSIISSDGTASWQIYRNEQYGYEIKYPQNYYVFDNYLNEVSFSDKPNGDIDSGGVIIGVRVGDKNSALEYTGQSKKVLVGGLEGFLYDYLIEGIGKTLILPKNGEYFSIGVNVRGNEKDKYYSIFNQTLSTFKFIEVKKPYIKVLSPNGGERWTNGQTYDITWESQGIDKVFITVIDYNVEETCRLTYDVENYVSAEKGKYSWTVGSGRCSVSPGDRFKIEIQETEGTSPLRAKDASDNYFIIEK